MDSEILLTLKRRNVAIGNEVRYGCRHYCTGGLAIRGMYNVYEVTSPGRHFQLICLNECDVNEIVEKISFSRVVDSRPVSKEFQNERCILKSTTLTRVRIGAEFNWCSILELFDPGKSRVFGWVFGFESETNSIGAIDIRYKNSKYPEDSPMEYEWIKDIEVGTRVRFASHVSAIYQKAVPGTYSLFYISGEWHPKENFQLICHSRCDPKLLLARVRRRKERNFFSYERAEGYRNIDLELLTDICPSRCRLTFTTERDSVLLKTEMRWFCGLFSFSDPKSRECYAWVIGNVEGVIESAQVLEKFSTFVRKPSSLRDATKFFLRKLIAKRDLKYLLLPKDLLVSIETDVDFNIRPKREGISINRTERFENERFFRRNPGFEL